MKRRYLFFGISLILIFMLFSCYGIPAPEVEIWATNPHGFDVAEFDRTVIDTQPGGGSYYNPDPERYYLDPAFPYRDTLHGNIVWIVPLKHYWSEVGVDSVTFWVRNGVDAYLDGYYCEFYRSGAVGEDNEFLFQSQRYSNIGLRLMASTRREDTLRVSLFGWAISVRDAVKMMYVDHNDPGWKTVQVEVHFYGTDDYGEGKDFDVTQDYLLYRTD
jgi:hypothetical protein